MASLTIENLAHSFGTVEVLKGIDLEIDDGEFLVLVGPSGCGKSTLLNMHRRAREDHLRRDPHRRPKRRGVHPSKRDIAMVFQSYALYPNMTVRGNIAFGMEMREVPTRPSSERAIERGRRDAADRAPARPQAGASSPAASASASRWAARWCATRRCSCSTSRCRTSTPSCASTCAPRSSGCTSASAPPSSTSRTTRSRR